ncbi:MAG: ABC transporter permease subunit [Rhodospirillales bacterium]|nr:ABC transporter permease subunit [Rhodospirillales bacterium]
MRSGPASPAPRPPPARGGGAVVVLAVPWIWLLLFLIAPTVIVAAIALAQPADGVPPFTLGLTLDNLALVLTDPFYRDALGLSLKLAAVSTGICLVIGYPMALAIARAPTRWRDPLLLAVMLPFWSGFLMRLNAWIGLLRDDGLVNALLAWVGIGARHLLYTDTALYLGVVYTYLPFLVLPLYARLARRDPVLEEAAADLGASPLGVFLRVTLPLSLPGVWAGCALVFVPAVGEYVIPELLGGPQAQLVGRVLWGEFFQNRDWPTAAALAIVLLLVLVALPALALQALRRRPARSPA